MESKNEKGGGHGQDKAEPTREPWSNIQHPGHPSSSSTPSMLIELRLLEGAFRLLLLPVLAVSLSLSPPTPPRSTSPVAGGEGDLVGSITIGIGPGVGFMFEFEFCLLMLGVGRDDVPPPSSFLSRSRSLSLNICDGLCIPDSCLLALTDTGIRLASKPGAGDPFSDRTRSSLSFLVSRSRVSRSPPLESLTLDSLSL